MTDNHLLLYRLAELMLQHEQHMLPVDLLFDDDQIGDFVKSIQIDSPYQQMLLEGILTESVKDEKLFVNFTVEGFFHYVLGELLFNLHNQNYYFFLSELLHKNKLIGIKEGITQSLIRCANAGEYNPIINFIDNGNTEICILPIVTALSRDGLADTLSDILKDESDSDYAVILEVISLLNNNGKKKIIDEIFMFFNNYFEVVDLNDDYFFRQQLKIVLLNSFEDEAFTMLVESIINHSNNCFQSFSDDKKIKLLFELNNVIVNKGLLILSNNFAEIFNLYLLDVTLIIDNYYNLIYPLLELGKFEVAEAIYLRCEPTNKTNASFLNWSGFIYQSWFELKSGEQQHINKGLELYEMSSHLMDMIYGRYSIQKYQNLENLGYTYSLLNKYDESILILNQAIDIVVKTFKSKIVYQLGNLYEMLAVTLNEVGRYNEAINFMLLSDECKLLQVSNNSPEMAWNHSTRSKIYLNMNNIENAVESMRLAYNIRKKSLGEANELTKQTKEELNKLTNDL